MSSSQESAERPPETIRAVVQIAGNVQGVGFRPFLYQLAIEFGLRGQVGNSAAGVSLEIEGSRRDVESFLADLPRRSPPLARITDLKHEQAEPIGYPAFVIVDSLVDGHRTALISADVSVCDDCLAELFHRTDRRYRYPFINCTNCGPRYTIISGVPYDRAATSMACFDLCSTCQAEYDDPGNRRFHAQPNACPACGPSVWLVHSDGEVSSNSIAWRQQAPCRESPPVNEQAIEQAARLLDNGAILAVKGIGGFHLVCDATNTRAVQTLRDRKGREERPFALMVPDLESAAQLSYCDREAESLLASRQRPITLLPRREEPHLSGAVAPGNDRLGLMLPYTPLQYLLFMDPSGRRRFRALVMTSGNRKDEPIAIGNREALGRLHDVADAFLLHDRDILIRADDSVLQYDSDRADGAWGLGLGTRGLGIAISGDDATVENRVTLIRRARGYVPTPLFLHRDVRTVLAVGAHLKNTVAVSRGKTVFLSQHIGDLETPAALEFLKESVQHLCRILDVQPTLVAHDLHPDYLSTRFAQQLEGCRTIAVQHHHAHLAACMAEHGLDGPVIGIALDGTGLGTDGRVWGGEVMLVDYGRFQRVAHLRELPLPGGERAIDQPWRMALSYLDATFGEELWSLPIPFVRRLDRAAAELLLRAARQRLNSPLTSSCGRLFDAVAALIGIRQTVTYEGQAAIELETAMNSDMANHSVGEETYRIVQVDDAQPALSKPATPQPTCQSFVLDPEPLIKAVVVDLREGVSSAVISYRFHCALVQSLAAAAVRIGEETGISRVVLGGGCFQNQFLASQLCGTLGELGFTAYRPHLVPPNDGGLALGQIVVASALADHSSP